MPPHEEDELISSWLDRVARFYGESVADLLTENGRTPKKLDLGAIDIGLTSAPLAPIALLLNTSVSALAGHTVAAAYPWATNNIARERGVFTFGSTAPLRPAVCPWCLEQQRSIRGFSWLRREWVLAWRTICPHHGDRLIEGTEAAVVPGWEDFFRRHPRVQQATCAGPTTSTPCKWPAPQPGTSPFAQLERRMLHVQNLLAADPKHLRKRAADDATELALMIRDILWALARADRMFPERLAYEAFALQAFDSDWHIARRRSEVPADYTRLSVGIRHAMMASAALIGGGEASSVFGLCLPRSLSDNNLAFLLSILTAPDAEELIRRSSQWSARSQTALLKM